MNKYMKTLLDKVDGLECIVISDREGVTILSACTSKIADTSIMSSILSTFCLSSHQGSKLNLGEKVTSVCIYQNFQVIQMDILSMIVTFIGNTMTCNTGHVMALSKELHPLLTELKTMLTPEI